MHSANKLLSEQHEDGSLVMLTVDFSNAFNLVDRSVLLREVRMRCPSISLWVEFLYGQAARLYLGDIPATWESSWTTPWPTPPAPVVGHLGFTHWIPRIQYVDPLGGPILYHVDAHLGAHAMCGTCPGDTPSQVQAGYGRVG